MYGSYQWCFENLFVFNDNHDGPCNLMNIEFSLICTELPTPPSGRDEFYDPGSPAVWEIEQIEIVFDLCKPLTVTEEQLDALFPNGADMINNALEAAAENGVIEYG